MEVNPADDRERVYELSLGYELVKKVKDLFSLFTI